MKVKFEGTLLILNSPIDLLRSHLISIIDSDITIKIVALRRQMFLYVKDIEYDKKLRKIRVNGLIKCSKKNLCVDDRIIGFGIFKKMYNKFYFVDDKGFKLTVTKENPFYKFFFFERREKVYFYNEKIDFIDTLLKKIGTEKITIKPNYVIKPGKNGGSIIKEINLNNVINKNLNANKNNNFHS